MGSHLFLKGTTQILVLHGAAGAPAGVIQGVSRDTVAVHKHVPEWPKWRRGLWESPSPPHRAPLSRQKKPWQDRGSWDPSLCLHSSLLLLLAYTFVAFESPGQKLVKLITQGSAKTKVKVPAPYTPLSLLYEVCRFSDVLSSFPFLNFCIIIRSKASKAPLKYKQQIISTQTQLSLCLQINLQLETELGDIQLLLNFTSLIWKSSDCPIFYKLLVLTLILKLSYTENEEWRRKSARENLTDTSRCALEWSLRQPKGLASS